ncbi:LytR/AlgR family response regulator transcription factor [Viscerimonas tarda]
MINCIIVEDTPLAVEKLDRFIRQVPLLNLLASFDNGIEAISFMQTQKVDLVFLDIQMEQFTGLQFLEAVQFPPKIIIVSAYSEYAIHGFEHNVTDYLLKPYSFERFLKAIDKVQADLALKSPKTYLFVKTEYRMERIDFCDILYIEGMGAYLRIVTNRAKIMTLQTFSQLEKLLPSEHFQRIHKSFIVSLNKIESIERNVVKIGGQRIPIGKNYQDEFYKKLE